MIASMLTGTIMTLIRIQEPYFKYLIKKQWNEFFGILLTEEDIKDSTKYLNDSLATFLTSSLNVELVYAILSAITEKSAGREDKTTTYLDYTK